MDHEANMVYLNIEDSILIEKNSYCIKNENKKIEEVIVELEKSDK
jgi:hypothetical protein